MLTQALLGFFSRAVDYGRLVRIWILNVSKDFGGRVPLTIGNPIAPATEPGGAADYGAKSLARGELI